MLTNSVVERQSGQVKGETKRNFKDKKQSKYRNMKCKYDVFEKFSYK